MSATVQIDLGGDSDCESCGRSWNELFVEVRDDESGAGWRAQLTFGCYDGESTDDQQPNSAAELETILEAASRFPKWTADAERRVREFIAAQSAEDACRA